MSDAIELHPALVLGAFCEGLVGGGRRVALFGDGTSGLALRLAEASGRRVHVFDPDAQRVSAWYAAGQPHTAAMSYALFESDLDVRSGAFDVVVVPDLTAFAEAAPVLGAARALVSNRGIAVVASPNPERHARGGVVGPDAGAEPSRALAYLALYDACNGAFPAVKVLGQAAFAGQAFADFGASEPAVTIDTSLCTTTEEPSWFVLVAGERAPVVDPYTLVQVPAGAFAAPPADPAELVALRLRTTVLEGEMEKLRERERQALRSAEERLSHATAQSARAAELEAQHTSLLERYAALEALHGELAIKVAAAPASERFDAALATARVLESQLIERDAALSELRARLERERQSASGRGDEIVKLRGQGAELEQALVKERERATKLGGELANEREHARVLDQALRGERERLTELESLRETLVPEPPSVPRAKEPEPRPDDGRDKHIQRLLESVAQAQRERDEARARTGRLEDQLAEAERETAAIEARMKALVERLSDPALADVHAGEIDALEARLGERGHEIDALKRDLAEAERFGRELIRDLEGAHALGRGLGAPSVPSTAGLDPLVFGSAAAQGAGRAEPEIELAPTAPAATANTTTTTTTSHAAEGAERDTLVQKCTRLEADLEALRWRYAALEAERSAVGDPDGVPLVQKLEAALLAAREELASVRRGG